MNRRGIGIILVLPGNPTFPLPLQDLSCHKRSAFYLPLEEFHLRL